MDIVVDKSSLGIQTAAGFTVQTRQATSTVRVKDGGVAVIGGVLEVSDSITRESVPIVSKIPLLGALFRNKLQRTQNTELLIFISPKVIG
jgi:type IV pilus assembly protein PilQ